MNKYKRAFKLACSFLNGDTIGGVDADILYEKTMKEFGLVSSLEYEKFILKHLDRFSNNNKTRLKAFKKLGW